MSNKDTTVVAQAVLVDVAAVTVEVIDPATALLEENVRSTPVLDDEFVDSIRADGVREPVKARRGEDGRA